MGYPVMYGVRENSKSSKKFEKLIFNLRAELGYYF